MSKFSKLINKPELFVKDLLKKRLDIPTDFQTKEKSLALSTSKTSNEAKKIVAKKNDTAVKKVSSLLKEVRVEQTLITEFVELTDNYYMLIHCGESASIGYLHTKEWCFLLSDFKKSIIFLVRNLELYNKLTKEFPEYNIAFAKNPIDIEALLAKFLVKNIFFTSNTANNIHLLRFNDYNHIFIGCYDPLRQPDMHKYLRVYDELWLHSASRVRDFLENNDPRHLKIVNIGNPYNDYLFTESNCIRNIVYVPDFTIEFKDSFLLNMVDYIKSSRNKKYLFSFFLQNKQDIEIFDSSISQIQRLVNVVQSDTTDLQLLSTSQVAICDFNNETLITKFLNLNIPVLLYLPQYSKSTSEYSLRMSESLVYQNCYIFSDENQMISILNNLENGGDDLKEKRKEYLSDNSGITPDSNVFFRNFFNDLIN